MLKPQFSIFVQNYKFYRESLLCSGSQCSLLMHVQIPSSSLNQLLDSHNQQTQFYPADDLVSLSISYRH